VLHGGFFEGYWREHHWWCRREQFASTSTRVRTGFVRKQKDPPVDGLSVAG
jgi:hypothetical protein